MHSFECVMGLKIPGHGNPIFGFFMNISKYVFYLCACEIEEILALLMFLSGKFTNQKEVQRSNSHIFKRYSGCENFLDFLLV